MMTTFVFNWISLDVKGLALVALGSKKIAEFDKINKNPFA